MGVRRRLRALDLFCGGGGVAEGLLRAGFDVVVGVDREDHSKAYPGEFILADVRALPVDLSDFDMVWASPPCQTYSNLQAGRFDNGVMEKEQSDYIPLVRELLARYSNENGDDLYTVIENVTDAPIRKDLVLTGPMFGLDRILRKRKFELSESFMMLQPPVINKRPQYILDNNLELSILTNFAYKFDQLWKRRVLGLSTRISLEEGREAMGIENRRMTMREIGESVPPAYAEYIGLEVIRRIRQ